jgi:hypothetical protein
MSFRRTVLLLLIKSNLHWISYSGGYINSSIPIQVKVIDTNGEGVEGAPVTFAIASGDNIGSFATNPVSTNASGMQLLH